MIKTNWTTSENIYFGQIIEVDMISAGMTIIRLDKLLPERIIKKLEKIKKSEQSIAIGKISRITEFKTLSKLISNGIRDRVQNFLMINEINDNHLISIKKDAVFVRNIVPKKLILDDGTQFRFKNNYTTFLKLGQLELYAVPRRFLVDVKGIKDSSLHQKYMIRFILDILNLLEQNDRVEAAATIQQFRKDYIQKLLPIGFYREFNSTSCYTIINGRNIYQFETFTEDNKETLNIIYNLKNIILILANIV
jgi:hypothetical protein